MRYKPQSKRMAKKRDYAKEYREYQGTPEQLHNQSMRHKARRLMGLKTGDPREVDHITPMKSGGGNGKSNLRIVSRHANRVKSYKSLRIKKKER